VAEPSDNSTQIPSNSLSLHPGEGIIIAIGTGDGLFVYQSARANPKKFYIGIDASPGQLEKISEKIHRRPAKGGAPNALFLQAAIEDLPSELDGVADEVHIHFPWGSLLRGIAVGDSITLKSLRRICSADAFLEIVFALDPVRDRAEIERLEVPALSTAYIDKVLSPHFRDAKFEIVERGEHAPEYWPEFHSSWAKRLKGSTNRPLIYIIARAR
jgi:16S rRNA (adenine(1408)-N(1))-methyltransferase